MSKTVSHAVLSDHAREEMKRRAIDEALVRGVLEHPERRHGVRAGRDVLQSRVVIEGKTYLVRVFVDTDREPPEVVTVYRTSKVHKYEGEVE